MVFILRSSPDSIESPLFVVANVGAGQLPFQLFTRVVHDGAGRTLIGIAGGKA